MLPGFYGLGTAVRALIERDGESAALAQLRRMHGEWPFFQAMLSNCEMVLAKADMSIAHRYSTFVADQASAREIYGRIAAEYESTKTALLHITQQPHLLANNAELAASIGYRLPYLNPLNLVQVSMLRRYRETRDSTLLDGIHISINGISANLRNSG